jgi:inorganic pyrophosphatase
VRVIGALVMEDEKGDDPKTLSVPVNDARLNGYQDLADVHSHKLREILEFFETYERLEPHKWVKFKEWKNALQAEEIMNYALEEYEKIGDSG